MFAKSCSSKQMLAFEITSLASCESEFLFVQKNTTKTNMSNLRKESMIILPLNCWES